MKKYFLVLVSAIVIVGLASCSNSMASNNVVKKTVQLPYFNKIDMKGVGDVHFMQSGSSKMKIEGNRALVDNLQYEVKNGVLTMRTAKKKGNKKFVADDDVDIYLYSPDLIGVSLMGVGDFEVEKSLDTDSLSVDMRGVGDIELSKVHCDYIYLSLKGTGDIDVESLTTAKGDLDLKGTGDIEVNFKRSGDINCGVNGTGDITLTGDVKSFSPSTKGVGNLNISGLKVGR